MYTQCPQCLTVYEIDEDALQASLGIVHCGRCNARFDALRTLSDSLPEVPLTPLPRRDLESQAPTLTEAVPPAAYESAARRRRSQRTATQDGQRELTLAPSTATGVAHVEPPPAEPTADDWFADFESELAGEASAAPVIVADADDPPDDSTRDHIETDSDTTPHATVHDAAGAAQPAAGLQTATTLDDDKAPPPAVETQPTAPTAPAAVVSPRLLEGDVFDAETAASTAAEGKAPGRNALEESGTDPQTADGAKPDGVDASSETAPDASVEIAPEVADAGSQPEPTSAMADATSATTPVYVRPHRHLLSTSGLAWSAGCLLLALALAVQLAWANRVELVLNPSTRGWTQRLCGSIPCRLPPIKDVAQLDLLSRDVRPDPNAPGALMITATLRNNASFRQPWPVVTVELTDFDNHAVAMRRFRPAEYMPDAGRRAAGIAPGATAAVAFEVADPGKRAGGYRFGFE